ncbi:UvrD-helicase domain-containing protein, partial [Patescibacteria group bacterium]|nr:UvrD-helicase domain-containing protein [Patescibacteria group bacterium]
MIQKNFNCLDRETNIYGNHLLEASAGTGKTFAIEQIVVRLLLEKEEPAAIDEILVVTFTKAATKELKLRIRSNIEKNLQLLKKAKSQKSEVQTICYDYLRPFLINDRTIDRSVERLEEALLFYDQAQIFTIHGFCYRMLKEFAFYAKVKLSLEEGDNSKLIKEAIVDHLKYLLDKKKYGPQQISLLISKNRNIGLLIEKLIKKLDEEVFIKEEIHVDTIFNKFCTFLNKSPLNYEFEKLLEDFENISSSYKKKYKGDIFEDAKDVFEIISSKKCTFQGFDNFLKSAKSINDFIDEKNKKVRSKEKKINYPDFFSFFKNEIFPIFEKLFDYNIIFSNLLFDISKRIKEIVDNEEIFTFDKILEKMKESLSLANFKEKVQNRYEAVLVDEFQDTDPVQWEIFEKLFLSQKELKAFYLIGDPKQSIYRFRKADIYTYLK